MLPTQVPAAPSNAPQQGDLSQPESMTETLSPPAGDLAFVSPRDLARMLGVTIDSIYRLVARRALPAYRVLRRILFRRSDVEHWLAVHRTNPRDPSIWQ